MRREIILGLVICVLALCGSGCKKNEKIHYTIPSELKEWFLFNKGSYWIYRNENGLYSDDSCYLARDAELITTGTGKEEHVMSDIITMYFTSSFLITCSINPAYVVYTTSIGSGEAFYTDFDQVGSNFLLNGHLFQYLNHFDTLVVNNIQYYDVKHTSLNDIGVYDTVKFDYYFARHIGLIKFSKTNINSNTTWSLIRYEAKQ